MNLSPRWIGVLVTAGFEAVHWSSCGDHNASDLEIMAYARGRGAVVLTHDLDFGAILAATGGQRPSVVQVRAENVSPEAIGHHVTAALLQLAPELEAGALITIDAARVRSRVLPLRTGST